MPKVTLRTAFEWDCEVCSFRHFETAWKTELTIEEREEAYRFHHCLDEWSELPEGWETFELVQMPKKVTCQECGAAFETQADTVELD